MPQASERRSGAAPRRPRRRIPTGGSVHGPWGGATRSGPGSGSRACADHVIRPARPFCGDVSQAGGPGAAGATRRRGTRRCASKRIDRLVRPWVSRLSAPAARGAGRSRIGPAAQVTIKHDTFQ